MRSFFRNIYLVLATLACLLFCSEEILAQTLVHTANDSIQAFDIWGYEDAATGSEYAVIGHRGGSGGVSIYNVDDPYNPSFISFVDSVTGFDVKVWDHYIYTTGGNSVIIDIADINNPVVVGAFPYAHNIFIDDQGFMYAECPKLTIYDLNIDPIQPTIAWVDTSSFSGCHDATVIGDRLFDFHGVDGTFIYDVTDRYNPVFLNIIDRPTISYHHSGWTSEDGNYLYIADEGAKNLTPDITIWDISDIVNPVFKGGITDTTATVHNVYVIGNFAYVSYYTAGIKVFDITDPENPVLAGEYDTIPSKSGEGFDGAFGIYPFTSSGTVYVSDMTSGLHIFSFDASTSIQKAEVFDILLTSHPNPSYEQVTLSYYLPISSDITITLFDVMGREIIPANLVYQTTGYQEIDLDMEDMPAGVYYCTLKIKEQVFTKKLVRI